MIKIRYTDLPGGLHAHVERCGRRAVIYLAPGLPPGERRDALRRLVRLSRRGHAPRLHSAGVWLAAARDDSRATVRNAVSAVRCHPAGALLLAVALASGLACYAIFVSVTIGLLPAGPGGLPRPPAAPVMTDRATPLPGGPAWAAAPGGPLPGAAGRPARSSAPADPARPLPRPSPAWSAPGGEVPAPSPDSSPAPAATTTPSPARGSAGPPPGDPGGLCVGSSGPGGCVPG